MGRATTPDGIIAGDKGTMLFVNNDASNVMRLDPADGMATVIHKDTNTGGALSRSKRRVVPRGARTQRRHRAARSRSGSAGEHVQRRAHRVRRRLCRTIRRPTAVAVSTWPSRAPASTPRQGRDVEYGEVPLANGIVLSGTRRRSTSRTAASCSCSTSRPTVTGQSAGLGKLRGGQGGDGSAIETEGRLYMLRPGRRSMSSC